MSFRLSELGCQILRTIRDGFVDGFPLLDERGRTVPGWACELPQGVPHGMLRAALLPVESHEALARFDSELTRALRGLVARQLVRTRRGLIRHASRFMFRRPDALTALVHTDRTAAGGGYTVAVGTAEEGNLHSEARSITHDGEGIESFYMLTPRGFELLDKWQYGNRQHTPRRGRPTDTDAKGDAELFDLWQSGSYATYAALARAKGLSAQEVTRAIDRHRKRIARRAVK